MTTPKRNSHIVTYTRTGSAHAEKVRETPNKVLDRVMDLLRRKNTKKVVYTTEGKTYEAVGGETIQVKEI